MGGKDRVLAQQANTLGTLLMEKGELDKSERALRTSENAFAAVGDDKGVARVLNELGLLALQQDRPVVAAEAFCRSIELKVALSDNHGLQLTLQNVSALLNRHPEVLSEPCIHQLLAQLP